MYQLSGRFRTILKTIPKYISQKIGSFVDWRLFAPAVVLISTIFLSSIAILKFYGLQISAWDTGTYGQALYTAIFQGKMFYYTADLPANPTGSIFGVHFSPILLVITPFFWVYPSALTLLLVQAVSLALGGLPLYRFALARLGDTRNAATVLLAYLISPMILGVSWFGFHPEAFLIPSLLGAFYFVDRRKWVFYYCCIVAALATIETAPIIVALLGVYLAWQSRHDIVRGLRFRQVSAAVVIPSSTVALSLVWFVIALVVIRGLNPLNPFYFGSSPLYWTVLGAKNIAGIPARILLSPEAALSALLYDWAPKLIYVILLFGPLLFMSLRSRWLTLLTVPWLSVSLLSNFSPFYQIYFQYPSFVAPFIFIGAVQGLKKTYDSDRFRRLNNPKLIRKLFLTVSLISFLVASPIVPWFLGIDPVSLPYGVFSQSSHETKVSQMIALIPSDASVLTTPSIFPHVSSRANAYVLPISALFPPGSSFNQTLDEWLSKSDYVLLDYGGGKSTAELASTILALQRMSILRLHGLAAESDGVLLYRKGYAGPLLGYQPTTISLKWSDLGVKNGSIVTDPSSRAGRVVASLPGQLTRVQSVQWALLQPGEYKVSFLLKLDPGWSGSVNLGLVRERVLVEEVPIGTNSTGVNYLFPISEGASETTNIPANLGPSTGYQTVAYPFRADGLSQFMTPVTIFSGASKVYLDEIIIEQMSP
jgi:uncharacterized membrane protein